MSPPISRRGRVLSECAALGLIVLAVSWLFVHLDPRSKIDGWAFDTLVAAPGSRLGNHASSIAAAGSGAALAVTAVAVIYAARLRRWGRSAVIVVGFPMTWALGDGIKRLEQRPRPPYEVISAHGPSFPSTDSAISVGFVVVAATLAGGFAHRGWRITVVALGVLASLATGLLTVVFGDHYLTDVVAGWGLGAAVFSVLALAVEPAQR